MRKNERQVIHRELLDQSYFTFLVAYETVIPQYAGLPEVKVPGYKRIMSAHIEDFQMFFDIPEEIFYMSPGDTMEISMTLTKKEKAE